MVVYIFGELHRDVKQGKDVARFIVRKKPAYVLHEGFGDDANVDPYLLRDLPENDSYALKARMLGRASEIVGAKIAGCDPYMEKLLEAKKQGVKSNVTDGERERAMARIITDYAHSVKTDKPIVAIVGAYHAAKNSELLKTLESEGVEYKVIRPILPKKFRDRINSRK